MRPKLPAVKVSRCHPIPVILRASSRMMCPSPRIWAGSLPESHSRGIAQAGMAGAARP